MSQPDLLADDHPASWADDISMPALLRAAWRVYGSNVRTALAEADYDDLPRNGAYVIGAMANDNLNLDSDHAVSSAAALGRQLGVSKQAVSQLIDTLVLRGYLCRAPDPADRRRMVITLADRGEAAAMIVSGANDRMDAEVESMIGAAGLHVLRRQLAAVIHAGQHLDGEQHSHEEQHSHGERHSHGAEA